MWCIYWDPCGLLAVLIGYVTVGCVFAGMLFLVSIEGIIEGSVFH